ncbi:MAG TPA: hypothetical protein VN842_04105 [Thermoplasmata archaeon]|nr:hypothetical protein [Thermoplasmata archaeon]
MRPRGHDGVTIGVAVLGFACLILGVVSVANSRSGGGAISLALGSVLLVGAAASIVFIAQRSSFYN